MTILVGYTGFVGSNIYASAGDKIDKIYNSTNINEAFGTNPDILIFAGMRAEKYIANTNPEKDMELIQQAEENIMKINPKKLVMISTVDVLKNPNGLDENCNVDIDELHAYGYHRFLLEEWARDNFKDLLIIRLPALFGKNIKKNFIYDYINIIPFMLQAGKMDELAAMPDGSGLRESYELLNNGFYKLKAELTSSEKEELRAVFKRLGFTALNFTDSRNVYQFYNLKNLYSDIKTAMSNNIYLWHPATEPVSAGELYTYLTGKNFNNEITDKPVYYDYRTKYSEVFGGSAGYIDTRENVMKQIKDFITSMA